MKNNYINKLSNFKAIYFYCCDPGSFYAAEPIFEDMQKNGKNVFWIFDGWCLENKKSIKHFHSADSFMKNIPTLKQHESCVVVGSRSDYNRNHLMIDFFKACGFYTIFLFDYWGNYQENFRNMSTGELHLTDSVFIMDDLAKQSMIKELSIFPGTEKFLSNIILTGHQGIEKTVRTVKNLGLEPVRDFRRAMNPHNKELVLFVLEPLESDFGKLADGTPYLGFDEFTVLKKYFSDAGKTANIKFLVKPHPRHQAGHIEKFMSEELPQNIDYSVIYDIDINLLLNSADRIIGMTSTFLLIALACGKPVTSLQFGRNHNGIKKSSPHIAPFIIS